MERRGLSIIDLDSEVEVEVEVEAEAEEEGEETMKLEDRLWIIATQ